MQNEDFQTISFNKSCHVNKKTQNTNEDLQTISFNKSCHVGL